MLVRDVMKSAKVINKEMTLKEASEIMKGEDVNSLIVVENKSVIGIVTHEDLVENFGKKVKVSKVMTKKIIAINPDEKTSTAIMKMKENNIRILPVIEKKELVGVVSAKDLVTESSSDESFLLG